MNSKKKAGKRVRIVNMSHPIVKKPKTKTDLETEDSPQKSEKHEKKLIKGNSIEDGKQMLEWMLTPFPVEEFFKKFWEKKPKLIKRGDSQDIYKSLLSTEMINTMLKENYLEYTKNIDITSYKDGVRETLNPEGRATTPSIWNYYADGCSIRILNPQTFIPAVYKMNSKLQEYFHCMIGTNVYLTPPNSQGFAPHYDDIEAFVLQLEGAKHWRVYKPRSPKENLPRISSENFSQDEIGEPILEVKLEPGDLLYFPRGFIHQAETVEGKHSLHITVSVYQKTSYADLLEALVPAALQRAINSDVRFREGLPLNIHQVMGIAFSENDSPERTAMREKIHSLFERIFDHASVDDAVDQIGKKYQIDALPPYVSKEEKQRTVYGEKVVIEDGNIRCPFEMTYETKIKLLKANILRLVDEDESLRVYFHSDNSKEYHEYEPTFMEIEEDDAPVISMLVNEYPKFVAVKDLPIDDDERKLAIATDLWEKGLLMTNVSVTDYE
ncbi:CLUMA_CG015212, isoform A [Clunio marinus]|uniref:Bifunctional lysine-specific demethylase and histidyl-hydroxylase n=1 Tax=Clunio marinus TaxID=568069 RepID=A0A1J1IQY0_9DIPT|nr:CLUMA_CG015212, isoform A [Clunio marinus]